ncbi:hypothetical protein HK413_08260 [Mucilaginibacter sp. S1162]|uniref:Uncharacterized protein n=1 Tax=Mucilaginibacter humi TaxID=2732510 RepID=A0ABX1W1N6_9SPHI|nr:hypothetical protein [Mucilaginibacter humi]NNU34142.1 hypothetical protein [Mucilaginibacter humi]
MHGVLANNQKFNINQLLEFGYAIAVVTACQQKPKPTVLDATRYYHTVNIEVLASRMDYLIVS